MATLAARYDSFLPDGAIFKEFKLCELCGYTFCREIGSANTTCFGCHKFWNARAELLPRIELDQSEVFKPEVIAATNGRCRMRKHRDEAQAAQGRM